ncbi:MAG TPA: hypothetical protein VMB66_16965, partial [Candidatus Acidoferrales bacterium]|nr:hypothetical protein [Candidatus Acidoferrales bacterium]
MKALKRGIFTAITLAALTAGGWAQTQTASNVSPLTDPAAAPAATHAAAPAAKSAAPSSDSDLRLELEQLKALLHEQQQRIDALEAGRGEKSATPAPGTPAVTETPATTVTT